MYAFFCYLAISANLISSNFYVDRLLASLLGIDTSVANVGLAMAACSISAEWVKAEEVSAISGRFCA